MQATLDKSSTPGGGAPPLTYGWRVARWIEANLVHGEGDWYGKPFLLEPWQIAFLLEAYALRPNGKRAYTGVLKGLPKGNGKTEIAAAIACHEFAGGQAESPIVPIAAASFEQADILFGAAKVMLTEGPLADYIDAYDTEIRFRDGSPGRMFRIAAVAGTNEGLRPTFFAGDELHEWIGARERLWIVMLNNLAKRGGWWLGTSTAGAGEATSSLLARLVRQGQQIRSGELKGVPMLFDWTEAAEDADLTTEEGVRAALLSCNPAIGSFLDLEHLVGRWRDLPEHDFRRYHLNQHVSSPEAWLKAGEWERCETPGVLVRGATVALGFAGNYAGDRAALVACRGNKLYTLAVWDAPEGERVSRAEVNKAVSDAFARYRVTRLEANPHGWEAELERWGEVYGRDVVLEFSLAKRMRWAEACSQMWGAAKSQELEHDGDPRLTREVREAQPKRSTEGTYLVDAGRVLAAAVLAHDAALSTDVSDGPAFAAF